MHILSLWDNVQKFVSNLPFVGKLMFSIIIAVLITIGICVGMHLHSKKQKSKEARQK